MLDVCLPGTGGMIPVAERWLSCCWLEYLGSAILIDCGEGTQIALKKSNRKLSRLDLLLLTHYHADHVAGLPGLLLSLGNTGKQTALTIVGPEGLQYVVSALTVIAPRLTYPVELIEIKGDSNGYLECGELSISYLQLNHGVRCLGYRVSIRRKPIFNPDKAEKLRIPKKLYKLLHDGKSIRLEDGRSISPDMVLDGERAPLSVCFMTDSVLTEEMAGFASGADLLICEGMYGDEAMAGKMLEKGHMIFSDSAHIAKNAAVGQLWLTHFSPALTDPEAYAENARTIFPNTTVAHDGICITL
jgi:ribonuclease Z